MFLFLAETMTKVADGAKEAVKAGYSHGETIAHHLTDAVLWKFQVGGMQLDITKRVVIMWVVSFFLLAILIPVARKIAKRPLAKPTRLTGFIEVFVNFVRHDIGHASMGHHHKPYDAYFLTLFFFILFSNLIGLIPSPTELGHTVLEILGVVGHFDHNNTLQAPLHIKLWPAITATGDINVTLTLAAFTLLVILISGFAFQGIGFVKNIVPKGIPAPLWLIMWPIEFAGLLIKPAALSIRLLANMTAGHMIIIVLLGFIFQFKSFGVVPLSILGSVAIYMLEIFVAFLQAYIFVFLSSLFIGQAQHRH